MACLLFGLSSLPGSSFRPTRNLIIGCSSDRQALFNRIAPVYDNVCTKEPSIHYSNCQFLSSAMCFIVCTIFPCLQLNDLLSLGQHRIWKRMAVSWSGAKEGDDVLDICCGSGDLTFLLSERVGPHGKAVGLDFSNEQLLIASTRQKLRSKTCYKNIKWMEGNALDLSFPDSSFDAVTIGYGLRNVVDRHKALAEICRVLKPGSTVSVLDFNKSINPFSTTIQELMIDNIVVPVASGYGLENEYKYLKNSIKDFLTGNELEKLALEVGFSTAKHFEIGFGFMGNLVAIR